MPDTPAIADVDGAALLSWARRCVDVLDRRADEINQLNVFPVPDADTGSNMAATMRAALESAERAVAGGSGAGGPLVGDVATALAAGAVRGARGNSGTVLTQVLRAIAESAAEGPLGGRHVQRALETAVRHVDAAIADPVEGTILTVLRQAAVAAARRAPDDVADVVAHAAEAARLALERTPTQLAALREAGVVDAGGAGLVLLLDALLDEITGEAAAEPDLHVSPAPPEGPELEVMFVLPLADGRAGDLREVLRGLGNSLVIAAEDGNVSDAGHLTPHMVHIHTPDAGAVIEAALDFGRPEAIRIEVIAETLAPRPPARTVLAVAPAGPVAELFASAGAVPVSPEGDVVAEILSALSAAPGDGEVVLLPNGLVNNRDLIQVELAAKAGAHAISILPSATLANGLAAVAVHDPTTPIAVDAYAMSEAAAGMRTATLTRADGAALTAAGPCVEGDVLATVGGDILVVAGTVEDAMVRTVELMLRSGGELVTILMGDCGDGADPERCVGPLRRLLAATAPEIDVTVYPADGMAGLAQIGVE